VTVSAHVARRVVTCDARRATGSDPLGVIEDGAIVVDDGTLSWAGPRSELPQGIEVTDHGDCVLTPGFVDAHTHACWAGSRHDEYAVRMAGGGYEAIAARGGGILSTHRAVLAATVESLAHDLRARLRRMAALGVTTVEVKSGYGLVAAAEVKQLEAIAAVAGDGSLPRVVPTFLALHALPPHARESQAARDAYVSNVADVVVCEVAARGLATFVDAYVDREAFQIGEARRVFEAARRAGLGIRVHAGQFADIGGAELASELGAASVDHLEHVGAGALRQLAAAGSRPVLLPVASFTLGQSAPPVGAMRDAGLEMVVASDANPGTAPTESLPLALAFAVRSYGLTPTEALLGATRHAAASLTHSRPEGGLPAAGVLAPGAAADFVVWDLPHELCIVQPWGAPRTRLVCRGGAAIHRAPSASEPA
jgi:imidazolonepropionase